MKSLDQLKARTHELAHLSSVLSLLAWDQEVMMPAGGSEPRAGQRGAVAALYHALLTDPELGEWLTEVIEGRPETASSMGLFQFQRDRARALQVPASLVEELARTCSIAYEHWVEARRQSSFELFAPWLEKIVALKEQEAACLLGAGYASAYESLLDEFEPGSTVEEVEELFRQVRPRLSELNSRIQGSSRRRAVPDLTGEYAPEQQEAFGREVLTAMGFSWKQGRLDRSPHPFCTSFAPTDVRITTRFSSENFSTALFGIIHEGGHALYEQGLPRDDYGLPVCEAVSLGIHESQSRLWENFIGRSRPFWHFWLPRLKKHFPAPLGELGLEPFLLAVNRVEPSLIRVEADEVTYGLHVILRFELERKIFEGGMPVRELPNAWNDLMDEYLGVRPDGDADGVLQDTHWSQGLFGYFPTYLLGNLYAAQFLVRLRQDLPDLDSLLASGRMEPVQQWLRHHIHRHGRRFQAGRLVERVCGQALNARPFLDYLDAKYTELYRL